MQARSGHGDAGESMSLLRHIGGTLARDLSRSVENCRDLNRRSGGMPIASAEVREIRAQDAAYRPTHPCLWMYRMCHGRAPDVAAAT
jgi:hypothetical protein